MTSTAASSGLRHTPLYASHVGAGAKMVPFGGWEMPLHYGSALEEHRATRTAAGLFDVSHMGQVEFRGDDALAFVQRIVTNDVARLGDGDELYTVMCREDGGLIDDLIVSRFAPDHYFAVVNAGPYEKDVAFMREVLEAPGLSDVTLTPCLEQWAMVALQGPKWKQVLAPVLGEGEWSTLDSFHARRLEWRGGRMIFSTTGYTGEPGCELLVAPEQAAALWDALVEAGAQPCGLAARDSLRLEAGLCLSGQDFTEENNPYEAGLAWVVKLGKDSDFSGRAALEQIKAGGPVKRLVGLLPEGKRIPRHGHAVIAHGADAGSTPVGEVTSGGYSPTLERPIALAYVETAHAKGGSRLAVDLGRNQTISVEVTKPAFYKPKH